MNAKRKRNLRIEQVPIRLLTAVPICDGHDSAITTVNLELIRNGMEVVYLGYNRSARDIARCAIQEDVRAIGISTYNGGHLEFFSEVLDRLKKQGASEISVFGGGGGTVTQSDAHYLEKKGVDRIFGAGVPLSEIVAFAKRTYGQPRGLSMGSFSGPSASSDREIAQLLSAAETKHLGPWPQGRRAESSCRVVGVTGPGGAGKTTLIDELVLRYLKQKQNTRVAILSHDPSLSGQGALLGDRAMMIYAQHERVFMRSLATRGQTGGVCSATTRCLQILRGCGFDLVLVETAGIGQEALPFTGNLVDTTILVMSPDYGSRLQLQKLAMLGVADIVVLNKADLPRAKTAQVEIGQLLQSNRREQKLVVTVAKRHRDEGVDELFGLVMP